MVAGAAVAKGSAEVFVVTVRRSCFCLQEKDRFDLENSARPTSGRVSMREDRGTGAGDSTLAVAKICAITNLERSRAYRRLHEKKQEQDMLILQRRFQSLSRATSVKGAAVHGVPCNKSAAAGDFVCLIDGG